MRLAFYAPYCAPSAAEPSGAAETARQIIHALTLLRHEVETASAFRSLDDGSVPGRGDRLGRLGTRLADRLIRRYQQRPAAERPQAWVTYHCGDEAVDWLGPRISQALGIPLVLIEPMVTRGPDRASTESDPTLAALARADAVITFTHFAAAGLHGLLPDPDRLTAMAPFLALGRFEAARKAAPGY